MELRALVAWHSRATDLPTLFWTLTAVLHWTAMTMQPQPARPTSCPPSGLSRLLRQKPTWLLAALEPPLPAPTETVTPASYTPNTIDTTTARTMCMQTLTPNTPLLRTR